VFGVLFLVVLLPLVSAFDADVYFKAPSKTYHNFVLRVQHPTSLAVVDNVYQINTDWNGHAKANFSTTLSEVKLTAIMMKKKNGVIVGTKEVGPYTSGPIYIYFVNETDQARADLEAYAAGTYGQEVEVEVENETEAEGGESTDNGTNESNVLDLDAEQGLDENESAAEDSNSTSLNSFASFLGVDVHTMLYVSIVLIIAIVGFVLARRAPFPLRGAAGVGKAFAGKSKGDVEKVSDLVSGGDNGSTKRVSDKDDPELKEARKRLREVQKQVKELEEEHEIKNTEKEIEEAKKHLEELLSKRGKSKD